MRKIAATMLLLLAALTPAFAQNPPKMVKAADGIFAAFRTHRLVGLGDWHGMAQELDFYAALVRDPRFAAEVGNIVLEMGSAAHQGTVDRYVNGENLPYPELRKVWMDTVGFVPTVEYLGTLNLYAAIRAANQRLPPERRIKVWLGEPPMDWSKIHTRTDLAPWLAQRESHPAALIEREILAKGKKALVIYGSDHFGVYPGGMHPAGWPAPAMRFLLDTKHPGALYVVHPYAGYTTRACTEAFEKNVPGLSAPSLISPIRGSSLETFVKRTDCAPVAKPAEATQTQWEAFLSSFNGMASDAFLYLGPRQSLTASPRLPDMYLDMEYRAEIDRRLRLRRGNGLAAIPEPANYPVAPQPLFAD
jgi:hypothetical protein